MHTGVIGKYDVATGTAINSNFIPGLNGPQFIAIVPEPLGLILSALSGMTLLSRRRRRV